MSSEGPDSSHDLPMPHTHSHSPARASTHTRTLDAGLAHSLSPATPRDRPGGDAEQAQVLQRSLGLHARGMGGKGSKELTFGCYKCTALDLHREGVLVQEPNEMKLAS